MTLREDRTLLGALAGAFALLVFMAMARGTHGAELAVGLLAIAAVAYLALYVRPSVYLTVGLGLTIFSGLWGQLGLAALPIKPDRLLLITGIAALIARAPGAQDRSPIRITPLHLLLLASATYVFISALLNGTLTQREGGFALLDRYGLLPYLVFLFAPIAFERERDREILLVGLVVLGGYLGLTALFETLPIKSLVFPHYIVDPNLGIHQDRARGPFLEAVANGLALVGCGGAAALAFSRWKGVARVLAAIVVVLCVMGLLFTVTRAIWIGSAVGALIVLMGFGEIRRWLIPVFGVSALALGVAFTFIPALSNKVDQRATDQLPVWDRKNTNAAALRMVAHRPLFGWGWSTFKEKSPPYFRQADNYPMTGIGKGVHNVALSNAVELGLVGTLLWAAALLTAVGGAIVTRGPPELRAWRMYLTLFACAWLVAAMLGPLSYAMPNLLLWMLAGIALVRPPAAGYDARPA